MVNTSIKVSGRLLNDVPFPQAKDVFKYKLKGDTRAYKAKANVRVRNLEAFNGIIHIVNRVLTITPEVKGDPKVG